MVYIALPATQELEKSARLSLKETRGSLHSGLCFLLVLCRHTTTMINAAAEAIGVDAPPGRELYRIVLSLIDPFK